MSRALGSTLGCDWDVAVTVTTQNISRCTLLNGAMSLPPGHWRTPKPRALPPATSRHESKFILPSIAVGPGCLPGPRKARSTHAVDRPKRVTVFESSLGRIERTVGSLVIHSPLLREK